MRGLVCSAENGRSLRRAGLNLNRRPTEVLRPWMQYSPSAVITHILASVLKVLSTGIFRVFVKTISFIWPAVLEISNKYIQDVIFLDVIDNKMANFV